MTSVSVYTTCLIACWSGIFIHSSGIYFGLYSACFFCLFFFKDDQFKIKEYSCFVVNLYTLEEIQANLIK